MIISRAVIVIVLASGVCSYINLPYLVPLKQAIVVGDNTVLPKNILANALSATPAMSYFSDHTYLIKALENTQWVQKVSVRKQYPGRWWLFYFPRVPVMNWVDRHALIDKDGNIMHITLPDSYRKLPEVHANIEQYKQVYALWKVISQDNHGWLDRLEAINYNAYGGWELVFSRNIKVKLGDVSTKSRLQHFLKIATLWRTAESKGGQAFDFRYKNSFSHKKDGK